MVDTENRQATWLDVPHNIHTLIKRKTKSLVTKQDTKQQKAEQ